MTEHQATKVKCGTKIRVQKLEASVSETHKELKCVTKQGTHFPSVPIALISKIVNYQKVKTLN